MDKLEALIAAVAIVMLVSIWMRTSVMLARLRSVAEALALVADGIRPLADSDHGTDPGAPPDHDNAEDARRALLKAQQILADAIGGSDGHDIDVRANMSAATSRSPRLVERQAAQNGGEGSHVSISYRSAGV